MQYVLKILAIVITMLGVLVYYQIFNASIIACAIPDLTSSPKVFVTMLSFVIMIAMILYDVWGMGDDEDNDPRQPPTGFA